MLTQLSGSKTPGTYTLRTFISDLRQSWRDRPFIWNESGDFFPEKVRCPAEGKVLVLGPHPDDPESVAITCRLLNRFGCDIRYAIASMSPSGVEDEYAKQRGNNTSISLQEKKIEIRRREQTRAAEMAGLTPDRLTFLDLEESRAFDSPENLETMRGYLKSLAPDIVILPVGKDPNRMHAWVYQVFRKFAKELTRQTEKPMIALYNEDPKTIEMRKDLFVLFGEEGAGWKRALLRIHDSQQQRNIKGRGTGFDERILRMNHLSYKHLLQNPSLSALSGNYAEVFEIELFDSPISHAVKVDEKGAR